MAFFIPSASIMGRNWDMHDWKYFAIPSSNIPKQLNSDDCGVFVAKWAQHISVGLPVDFPHRNMVNFRYSRHSKRKALSMYIPCTQIRKESLKRTTAASSQMSTTSTPHRVSMTNQMSVSNKATPATSPNSQAFAAKQTAAFNKANPTTLPNSQVPAAKQTSASSKANPTTTPHRQASKTKQTSVSNKATAATWIVLVLFNWVNTQNFPYCPFFVIYYAAVDKTYLVKVLFSLILPHRMVMMPRKLPRRTREWRPSSSLRGKCKPHTWPEWVK